jgi:hypothetical protein
MGPASESYGGLFSIALPLFLTGGDNPVRHLQAVTVTITNDAGSSNSMTASMP